MNTAPLLKRMCILVFTVASLFLAAQQKNSRFYLLDSVNTQELIKEDNVFLDSILSLYHKTQSDTQKLNLLCAISHGLLDEDLWPRYNQLLMRLSLEYAGRTTISAKEKAVFMQQYSSALTNAGFLCNEKGKLNEAMEYWKKSKEIKEKYGDEYGLLSIYLNMGFYYHNVGNTQLALDLYNKTRLLAIKFNDTLNLATVFHNLGALYDDISEIEKAREFYFLSLKQYKHNADESGVSSILNDLGSACLKQNKMDSALWYFRKSYAMRKKMNLSSGMVINLLNIGSVYKKTGRPDSALICFDESKRLAKAGGLKRGLAYSYINTGSVYLDQKKLNKAKAEGEAGLKLSYEVKIPEITGRAAELLYRTYKESGDFLNAFKMKRLSVLMSDSVNNERNRKQSVRKQFQHEYATKQAADSVRVAEERKIVNTKLEAEKNKFLFLIIALSFVLLVLLFVLNRYFVSQKQKKIIEQQKLIVELKQNEILDSIRYAKRIQTALVSSEFYINKELKRLNLPK